METIKNKFITVEYQLYIIEDGKEHLVEKTTTDNPFVFISGMGMTLEEFEKGVEPLEKGNEFNFTLKPEEAYGEYFDERVVDLSKDIFSINGHFDHENIKVDAVVPLQNEDGNRFLGRVLDITDEHVRIDLNHPLAGKALNFKGKVLDTREATNEEIQDMVTRMSGEGCGCGCDECDSDCDNKSNQHSDGCGCGCGHCH